jgi:hypothetical protein
LGFISTFQIPACLLYAPLECEKNNLTRDRQRGLSSLTNKNSRGGEARALLYVNAWAAHGFRTIAALSDRRRIEIVATGLADRIAVERRIIMISNPSCARHSRRVVDRGGTFAWSRGFASTSLG